MTEFSHITPQDIGRLYDQQSKDYISFAEESYPWLYLESCAFDFYIHDFYRSDLKVLDLGCGTGRVIKHLTKRGVLEENVTGVDISEDLLEVASANLPKARLSILL